MTNDEKRVRSALQREAARLVPEGTDSPGLPAARERGWAARWRVPLLAAAAVVVVAATVTTVVVSTRGDGQNVAGPGTTLPDPGSVATEPVTPPQFGAHTVERIKDYDSMYELAGDSTNIVIATPTGETRETPFPGFADSEPVTYAALTVDSVVSGRDVVAGEQIEVWARGDDEAGRRMFSVPGDYLLFLAPALLGVDAQDPAAWGGEYVVVGIYAGMYFHDPAVPGPEYLKTDLDMVELPATVDAGQLSLLAGWYDAAYLDHVAAGEIPELMPPLNRPAGTVASPIVGGPAEPFHCDGAQTSAAASPDEGGTLFGVTDTMFCVSLTGDSGPITGSEQLVAATPLRAVMRVGSTWQSQVAGVVDGSITTVVAIRGADDATHPDDPYPDWEVPLTELGGMRAFLADEYTRVVVAYSHGAEVSRWPVRPEFTADPTGGWGDDLEFYDLRDDLTNLVPAALTGWAEIDPTTIRVFFTGGSSACYGAATIVEEGADQVRLAVQTGWKPEVGGCDDMAVGAAVDIPLAAPLGDREIVVD